jgi:hypothetical protein
MELIERSEVRVRADGTQFVFEAEPDIGRLVIREESGVAPQTMCEIRIDDRKEPEAFVMGLERVLSRPTTPVPARQEPTAATEERAALGDTREQAIERATVAAR